MSVHTWRVPATVVRVVDGDTITLDLDLGWYLTLRRSCRIVGINAPERNTALGPAATAFLAELLPVGTEVIFTSTKLDKYGRPLGRIAHGVIDVSEEMIRAGWAVPA